MDNNKQLAKDLTLALLYLTSFEEDIIGIKAIRSWKGYSFDLLNELSDEKLITGSRKSKSIYLTEEGIDAAKLLIQKLEKLDK